MTIRRKYVTVDEPMVITESLISSTDTTYNVSGEGSITITPKSQHTRIQDLMVRIYNKSVVAISGVRLRIDNMGVRGGCVELRELQNSVIDNLSCSESPIDGVRLVGNCANSRLTLNVGKCAGFGVVVAGSFCRTLTIAGLIEECLLGQVHVQDMYHDGSIILSGRLNSIEGNGPPLTISAQRGTVRAHCDFRNKSDSSTVVRVSKSYAKIDRWS